MPKALLTFALGLGLLLGGTPLPEAHAQKGRSFSSGRSSSSSGRSSFSGGRSSSSSSGKGFSNRSVSGKGSVSPSPQRPSKPSGPTFSPPAPRPPAPKRGFDAGAGAAQRKAESQKTFERTKPAAPKTATPAPKTPVPLPKSGGTPSAPAPDKRFRS